MENKLEQLLNTLIQRGWKPFWVDRDNRKCIITYHKPLLDKPYFLISYFRDDIWRTWWEQFNIRELVSKESWLWQFVCENGMRPKRVWYKEHYWQRDNHTNWKWIAMESEPEYRLIEASLKDESELEDFLLNSISLHE